jgi:hypothetical protein
LRSRRTRMPESLALPLRLEVRPDLEPPNMDADGWRVRLDALDGRKRRYCRRGRGELYGSGSGRPHNGSREARPAGSPHPHEVLWRAVRKRAQRDRCTRAEFDVPLGRGSWGVGVGYTGPGRIVRPRRLRDRCRGHTGRRLLGRDDGAGAVLASRHQRARGPVRVERRQPRLSDRCLANGPVRRGQPRLSDRCLAKGPVRDARHEIAHTGTAASSR